MLTLCRYSVSILLLLGLSSGVGGQASQATSVELGDITEEAAAQFLAGEVAAVGDTVSYAFTLSAPRRVALGIRQQDTDADLVVVDASEAEVGRSATAGTANELVRLALGPGTYQAQVVAQAAGVNAYRLRYRVKAVEDDYGADVDTSGTVLVGESTPGGVDYVGDEDWFFIDLEAARTYSLQVAGPVSAPVMVGVYNTAGTEVTAGVSGLESASATFTPDTTALYYVAVAATDIQTGAYTLTVTDTTPAAETVSDAAAAASAEAAETVTDPAPTEARSSPPPPLWVGEMSVAAETSTHPAYQGYSRWSRHGSLSAVPSTPARPPIMALVQHAGGVYLGLSPAPESDFTLTVGTQAFRASASAIPTMAGGGRYWWADAGPPWPAGAVLAVSLTDEGGPLGTRPLAPPTVVFKEVPARHDGTTAFSVEIHFSEAVAVDAAGLEAGLVTVSGGTLSSVTAGAAPQKWAVSVQPTGAADVQVTIAGGVPCGQAGAVCTADGRALYNRASVSVAGPAAAVALAELTLAGVPLTPGFTPEQRLYTGQVGASVPQVTVTAVAREATSSVALSPADAASSVAGHQVALVAGGETAVTVTVTAADGASHQYWVVLSPPAGSPGAGAPQLSGLGIVGVETLGFDPAVARYAVAAAPGVTQVTVVVSRHETGAVVEVLTVRGDDTTLHLESTDADPATAGHQVTLAGSGDTLVLVRVTSADGQRQQCYVVLVHGVGAEPGSQAKHVVVPGGKAGSEVGLGYAGRALVEGRALRDTPAVPTLSALSLAGVSLSPAFASTTTDYTATVGAEVAFVTVAATATAATATVVITPADADPHTAGHQVALPAGVPGGTATETAIAVLVRAADSTLNAYLITVHRTAPPSNDATLSTLELTGAPLHPAFASGTTAYAATVALSVTQVTVAAEATHSGATVVLSPADADANTAGEQVTLGAGTTTITVTVTAEDGVTTQTYTVQVRAVAVADATLQALSLDGLTLSPAFASGTVAYAVTVAAQVSDVTLHLTPTHTAATVQVVPADADATTPGYQIPLTAVEVGGADAVTTIAIVVTAADTTTRQTYALTVTRTAPLASTNVREPRREDFPADTTTPGSVAVGGLRISTADPMPIDGVVWGEIKVVGDKDWFAVTFEAGKIYRMVLVGRQGSQFTTSDPYLRGLHDADGTLIEDTTNNDVGLARWSHVFYTAPTTGTYYIAAGAAYGPRATGGYTLYVYEVWDDYPADTSTTGTVEVGDSVGGIMRYQRDRDWFAVTLEAGTRYRVDLQGKATGHGSVNDPHLWGIYDANGTHIPGTYDDDSGQAGQADVWANSRVFFTPDETGLYYIATGCSMTMGTYTYRLFVTDTTQADDYPADTSTPGVVEVDSTATGWLHYERDRDWFGVELEAGTTYRLDVTGDVARDYGGTLHDPALTVYDPAGVQVPGASDDNSGEGKNARLEFTPATAGTYYIEIKDPEGHRHVHAGGDGNPPE